MPRVADPVMVERAREMRDVRGWSNGRIGRELGVAHTTVMRWLGPGDSNHTRALAEKREQAREMVGSGASYASISRSLGVSQGSLRNWFGPSRHDTQASLEAMQARRRAEADARYGEMVRLRVKEGRTNAEIARILDIHVSSVWKAMGPTPKRLGGKRQWGPAMVGRARYLREVGYTISEISEQTGVPDSTIGDWVNGMPCG